VDLMNDIYSTFAERFLKVQLRLEPPAPPPPPPPQRATKRYNALGILEDIPEEVIATSNGGDGEGLGTDAVVDIAPPEPPEPTKGPKPVAKARKDPVIIGAGRTRSLNATPVPANIDWSTVGRNDPCPCGSGKKFKKCHGSAM